MHMISSLPAEGKGWLGEILADFNWLTSSEQYKEYKSYNFHQWCAVIQVGPTLFIRNVKKFSQSPFASLWAFEAQAPPRPWQPEHARIHFKYHRSLALSAQYRPISMIYTHSHKFKPILQNSPQRPSETPREPTKLKHISKPSRALDREAPPPLRWPPPWAWV